MDTRSSLLVIHASAFFAPILAPVLFVLFVKDREVKDMAVQALLFHLLISFCLFIAFVLSFVLIGIPLIVFFAIVAVYYPIKGIVCAAQDRPFGYPIVAKWAP